MTPHHPPADSPSPLRLCRRAGSSLAAAGLLLASSAWAADPAISAGSLLGDMTNLAGMSLFPNPAYTCRQFSSYDRASKSPEKEWFANNDCGQYLRVEERAGRKESVMMDAQGPGAVVRIWSANPAGTLRVYLDGAEQPVIEATMADLLGGKVPGLPKPIAGEYSKGWNLYFPIPYARSCKITSDKGGFYYHVNYRTYAAGTVVETLQRADLQTLAPRVESIAARLAAPRGTPAEFPGQTEPFELDLAPGKTVVQQFAGPKAIVSSHMRIAAPTLQTALRGVLVRVSFDGQLCVEAPLGDVFGSAPGSIRTPACPWA